LKGELFGNGLYDDARFTGEVFERAQLFGAEFQNCTFVDCTFFECVFLECKFMDCAFSGCDLSLTQVPESKFTSVYFERTKFVGVDWTRAEWPRGNLGEPLNFSDCILNYCTFIGLDLRGFACRDSLAKEVDFRESDLSDADFSGTDLSESIFLNTILDRADFRRALNYSISPMENSISKAIFSIPEAMSLLYCMDIVLDD